jgi:hypothetical protein
MADSGIQTKELTPAQLKAVAAIVSSRSVRDAAKHCKTPERTLHRWLALDHFKAAIASEESGLIDYSMRTTLLLQEKAITTIEAILDDQTAPASIRLRAALGVLDMSVKLRELRDLEIRLVALEAALLAK